MVKDEWPQVSLQQLLNLYLRFIRFYNSHYANFIISLQYYGPLMSAALALIILITAMVLNDSESLGIYQT